MTTLQLNLNKFTKRYAISSTAFSSEQLFTDWLKENAISTDLPFDFIGPHALSFKHVAALQIGQSFKQQGEVLFINVDDSEVVREFILKITEYQATEMLYTCINFKGQQFVDSSNVNLHYEFHDEPLVIDTPETVESFVVKTAPENDFGIDMTLTMTGYEAQRRLINKEASAVRRLKHGPFSFASYNEGKQLSSDKFWIKANREAADANGGFLTVQPYFAFCDGTSVDMSWKFSNDDLVANDWVVAPTNIFLTDLSFTSRIGPYGNLNCTYELVPGEAKNGANKLIAAYDILSKKDAAKVLIISGDVATSSLLAALLTDMKAKLFGVDSFYSHTIIAGIDKPHNTDLVDWELVLPGIFNDDEGKVKWDFDLIFSKLTEEVQNDPTMTVIVDMKSLADTTLIEDPEQRNQMAIDIFNKLLPVLQTNPVFENTIWAAIDLDAEVQV